MEKHLIKNNIACVCSNSKAEKDKFYLLWLIFVVTGSDSALTCTSESGNFKVKVKTDLVDNCISYTSGLVLYHFMKNLSK